MASGNKVEATEVSLGIAVGSIIGILTGIGIFAIPGLGFLFGAGSIVGAIAGVDFGLMAGGLTTIFTSIGIDKAFKRRKIFSVCSGW